MICSRTVQKSEKACTWLCPVYITVARGFLMYIPLIIFQKKKKFPRLEPMAQILRFNLPLVTLTLRKLELDA